MKQTKLGIITALRICRELWIWLRENPGNDKCQWPGWETWGYMHSHCPCCEFVTHRHCHPFSRHGCRGCPLGGFAWAKDVWLACQDLGTPYDEWRTYELDSPSTMRAALKMVRACEKALRANGAKVETYKARRIKR